MSQGRFGAYVLQHRYRVDPTDRDKLLPLLTEIRDYALDLGVAYFEVWQDDNDPWRITEVHGYDSWSHYKRLSDKPMPARMEGVYESLERLIEGGMSGIETSASTPLGFDDD